MTNTEVDRLRVGDIFFDGENTVTIMYLTETLVSYKAHDRFYTKDISATIQVLNYNGYELQLTEPLDQAIQKIDKEYCSHKNQSKDQYFTAMVFITCKDCGKALN